ncbi:TRAP transporter substrate-binding protein DctP [Roseomonas haemaphysalidis]|uniref:TRAP transporter substrate-binding protein DctP n=1 Tax=Roseomonas haemaphysalidis TaxID=2768162 RepID=A0ABS3KJG5_9PROT|nr:TRAP transporter substrate-binding protein DctP [Roseomonas haemaphysalidis]MBO1077603.1 TRAP transporter substrate-binding protein DctP [Roseomonas haemaphysalidis]
MAITRRGLAASGLLLGGPRPARARTQWRAASAWPVANPMVQLLRRFCEEVDEASGGAVQIQWHGGGDLLKSRDIRQALQQGAVQIGDISLAAHSQGNPLLELDTVPMLARTPDEARRLAAVTRAAIEQQLQREGLTLLYWAPWSGAGLFSRFAIDSVGSLRGTRMRSMTPVGARVAGLAGATVAQVEPEDVPRAFATRQASVMLASAITGVDSEAWQFASYFTTLSSSFSKNAVCAQSRAMDALPAPRRALLREVAGRCEAAGWDGLQAAQAAAQQVLSGHGMTLNPPSPKLVEDFERIGTIILGEWIERAGAPGQRLLDAYREG